MKIDSLFISVAFLLGVVYGTIATRNKWIKVCNMGISTAKESQEVARDCIDSFKAYRESHD